VSGIKLLGTTDVLFEVRATQQRDHVLLAVDLIESTMTSPAGS
jgi:hypothetical protein